MRLMPYAVKLAIHTVKLNCIQRRRADAIEFRLYSEYEYNTVVH